MIKIAKILMDEFGITEADNPDGTDNDGGEQVIPSDVQHGMKSKIVSPNIINPMMQSDAEDAQNNEELQELRLPDNYGDIKPSNVLNVSYMVLSVYETEIDDSTIKVSIEYAKDIDLTEVQFSINNIFAISDHSSSINPMSAYSYVLKCIMSYIKDNNPRIIAFDAYSFKHGQNYDMLIKLLSKDIGRFGYECIKQDDQYYIKKVDSEDLNELRLPDNNDVEGEYTNNKSISTMMYNTSFGDTTVAVRINDNHFTNISDVTFTVNGGMNIKKIKDNPMKIYQYVISCILSYLKKYNPTTILLSPWTDSHKQNYDILLKLLSKDIDNLGYGISKEGNDYIIKKIDSDLEEMKRFAGLN